MAIIDIHINADGVEDYFNTLRGLLAGEGRTSFPPTIPAPDYVEVVERTKPVTAPGVVAHPEVKEAQAVENARASAAVEEAINPILDAHGHPWSADLHASTKTQTKDGLWRMKPGVERPAPAAGYPKEQNTVVVIQEGFETHTGAEALEALTPVEKLAAEAQAEATDTDDAEMWADATSAAPAVPAREWTDADLSKLCNQAAKALEPKGGVQSLKDLVAVYSAAGAVPHSRNIPVEDRERFAGEVEALAGITYEG